MNLIVRLNLYRVMMMISFFQDAIVLLVTKIGFGLLQNVSVAISAVEPGRFIAGFKEVVPTKMILTNSGPFDNGCSVTPKKEFHSNEDNKPESPLVSDSSIDSSSSCEIIFNNSEFINSNYTDDVDDDEDDSEDDSCSESDGDTSPNEDRFSHKAKKVKFNLTPVVHTMFKWDYAYRAARKGPWEQMARDRFRFKGRINSFRLILDPILQVDHRIRIWAERFS